MKLKYDPMTGERLCGTAKVGLVHCVACGISSADGDPALDIPYPVIERREESGNELLCEPCHKEALSAGNDVA